VEVGDLLVSADGRAVRVVDDLSDALDRLTGDSIEIGLVRGVEDRAVKVSFATADG
jgi:S1-C subfamily serine protease